MKRLLVLCLLISSAVRAQQAPFPGQPAGTNGQLQCNGNGVMGACNAFDLSSTLTVQEALTATGMFTAGADAKFAGPNPYLDIRSFGARAVNPNAAPAIPGFTATISGGAFSASVSSTAFVNGDPVVIYGAGATNSMPTPGAPTVTPSISQSGTGTGYVVNAPSGSTTYNYVIVARDMNQGLTAASAVGTTSTGSSSLGQQTKNLTSCARSGITVTCITSSPHGLSVGSMIWISQISDGTFSGWFQTNAVPDNTHFSFNTGLSSANAAPTSATGGTVTWFNCNHITWSAVTGAWQYYVYGRVNGSLALLGVSGTNGTTAHLYFDDFGSTMTQATVSLPYFVPTTPPGSATNDSLFTTVSSGGGTTNLTLANAAGNSVSGATILLDAGGAILAAAKAGAVNGIGAVYIPNTGFNTFPVNSFVNLSNAANGVFSTGVTQAGTLTLNDTIYAQGVYWYGTPFPQIGESSPPFNFDNGPTVNVAHANPGIYSFSPSTVSRVSIQTAGNGVGLVYDQINPASVLDSEFGTLANQPDFMGIGLWAMGTGFNTTFSFDLRRDDFVPTSVNPGTTMTPYFLCQFCGQTFLQNVNTSHRSVYAISSNFNWNGGRMNGGATPPLTISGGNGNLPQASASISNFEMDTLAQPGCAILNAFGGVAGLNCGTGAPSFDGVSNPSTISGDSSRTQTSGSASLQSAVALNQFGNNINVIGIGNGLSSQGQPIFGSNIAVPILAPFPAAPSLAAGTVGSGTIPAGTYCYGVNFLDINNGQTGESAGATIVLASGTESVIVTRPAAPLGTVAWSVYRNNGQGPCNPSPPPGGGLTNGGFGISLANTTFTDSNGVLNGQSPLTPMAGISSMTASGLSGVKLSLVDPNNSGFTASTSFPGALTANRTWKVPDVSGTVAFVDAAQTWSADQSFTNTNGIRFFGPNGVNWVKLTGPGSNPASNVTWQLPSADSTGTACFSSNGSGVMSFTPCSGGTGTPGGSNKNLQFNNSSSFGGASNANYTSATGVLDLSQLANSNNTITGHRFTDTSPTGNWLTFQNAALNSTLFNVDVAGNLTANSATLTTPLSYANGGTNTGSNFTNNQLVTASSGALSSLTGTLTGTNPVLTLTAGSASAVPLTLNTAATPTGDIEDLQVNSVKTSWFDASAFLHVPQTTYTGSGGLTISGNESTCPTPQAGVDILCVGNSTTHTIQSSLNGATFKDNTQWSNSGPAAHGVALVGLAFPQINATSAGTLGQAFVSGGPSADGAFGTLGAVGGGLGTTTNTVHGVLMGEGTSPVNASSAGISGQAFLSGGASADGAYAALNLAGGSNIITGICPVANGCTGASTLAGAGILTPTGSITVGHCAQWSASTVLQDSGSACGGAGGNPPLSTITAATGSNTINSTVNPQTWNWALTGSTTAFKFGENTAATGSSNILLQASTLSSSTAIPFKADNNGNGYQLGSTGLWQPVGTGALATPGSAHNLVVSQASSSAVTYVPPVAAGKVLIDNGPGNDPSFQDPVISQAYVNLFNAVSATGTATSSAVRNPVFSQTGTLQITWASITGSPSGCTLQIQGVDSLGNALNDGSTVSVSPANGTTSQQFTATAGLLTAGQVKAIYACSAYPSAGTLSLDFTPIPNVNVTNSVSTTPPSNASTNVTQFGGNAVVTGTGASGSGIPRFTMSNDSSLAANQSVNVNQIAGSAVSTAATGIQKVGITGNAGGAMDAAGQNAASPGNQLLVGGQFNTSPTTITNGNSSPLQLNSGGALLVAGTTSSNGAAAGSNRLGTLDGIAQTDLNNGSASTQGRDVAPNVGTDGLLWTASLPAMRPASYVASSKFAASSTTDNAVMPGNATNTVLLTAIKITCTQTTAGNINIEILKRSAADTSGTSASMTAVPDDSNYAAASSAPLSYTGTGPSVGAAVGDLDNAQIGCMASATATPNDIYILNRRQKPIVLRGTAQQVAVNVGNAAITGGTLTVTFEWIETKTITP